MITKILLTTLLFFGSIAYANNNVFYSLNEARNLSLETKQNIFIIFSSEHCPYCKKLKEEILDKNLLSDYIVCIIDINSNRKISRQYKIKSLPTSILINHQEDENSRIVGYSRQTYLEWIKTLPK